MKKSGTGWVMFTSLAIVVLGLFIGILIDVWFSTEPATVPDLTISATDKQGSQVTVNLGKTCFIVHETKDQQIIENKDMIFDARLLTPKGQFYRGCALLDEIDDNVLLSWEDGTVGTLPLSDFVWVGDKSRVQPERKLSWPKSKLIEV